MQLCGGGDAQHRARKIKTVAAGGIWPRENSMLHFSHCRASDLLHSPLSAAVILSSAENVLKK